MDSGLYVYRKEFSLALSLNTLGLGLTINDWVHAAISFRTKCLLSAKVHTSVVHPFPDEPSVPSNWTRGTFLFPSKGQAATFPDNYLPKNVSPLRFKEDDGDDDDGLDRDYLDDATLVIKVKPQKQQQNGGLKSDNKKRNLEDIESETSDNEVSDDDSSNKKRSVRSSQRKRH